MTNENAPWYFLSTLAQCAAAFAALVAVFATFRLQVNRNLVEDAIAEAEKWVRTQVGRDANLTNESVKSYLNDVGSSVRTGDKNTAGQLLKHIRHHEAFPSFLANNLGIPLKLWTMVFIGSVSPLPFRQLPLWFVLFVAGPVLAFFTTLALLSSNTFIQACLGRAAGQDLTSEDRVQKFAGWLAKKLTNTRFLYLLAVLLIVLLAIKTLQDWRLGIPWK